MYMLYNNFLYTYQAFATLSDKLEPLVEGVRDNRGHWIDLADVVKSKASQDQEPGEEQQKNVISNGDCKAMSDDDVAAPEAEVPVTAEQTSVNGPNVASTNSTTNKNIAVASHPTSTQPSDDDDDAKAKAKEENGLDDEVEEASNSTCSSSTASSRLSTPPPTGEDDSTPVSPSKTLQARLVAANLNALQRQSTNQVQSQKQRCKSCDHSRSGLQIRKTSSLRGTQELELDGRAKNGNNAALCKSTPVINNHSHHHSHSHSHNHNHNHNHHHHHHSHHNHGQHGIGIGSASIGGSGLISLATPLLATDSDRIPKIVGKLGNLDGLPFANGIGGPQNGHGLPLPFGSYQNHHHHHHLLARRHSETNSNGATAVAAEK